MTWQRTGEDYKRHGTQKAAILAHLREGRPLTQDEGRELYGAMRVASRISELRREGWLILSLRGKDACATYLLLSAKEGSDRA